MSNTRLRFLDVTLLMEYFLLKKFFNYIFVANHLQSDSKLLSRFLWPINGNTDNNLESPCIYEMGNFMSMHRNSSSIIACVLISAGICLPSRCLAMNYSRFQAAFHNMHT
jgi:hypothetical protein